MRKVAIFENDVRERGGKRGKGGGGGRERKREEDFSFFKLCEEGGGGGRENFNFKLKFHFFFFSFYKRDKKQQPEGAVAPLRLQLVLNGPVTTVC
jgi:hypothetical protein